MSFSSLISVGIGGFIGAILRYSSVVFLSKYLNIAFPFATLFVNIVGSFVMGALTALFIYIEIGHDMRLFFTTGILGAFTTFSTFSIETIFLFSEQSFVLAVLNIFLNIILSISFAFVGYKIVLNYF